MTGIEVFLIIIGVVSIVGSIIFSQMFENKETSVSGNGIELDEEEIRKRVNQEVDNILEEKVEDTEVRMERLMNEKITSMGEYSDNVLEDINKNHEEVMFIYGMLGDKEKEVKKTLIDIENVKKSVKVMEKTQKDIMDNSSKAIQDDVEHKKVDIIQNKKLDDEVKEIKIPVDEQNKKNSGVALSAKEVKQKKNNNEKILEQFNKGKTAIEIAKELNLGIGEVRLVIDLYNNR